MKKLFLSFFALTMAMLTWAAPNGNYQISKAILHYVSDNYKFAGGEEEVYADEDGWEVVITTEADGSCTLANLLGWDEALTGKYDAATGKLEIPVQKSGYLYEGEFYEFVVCGGIKDYTEPQKLMDQLDACNSNVAESTVGITFKYDEEANTLKLDSSVLVYTPDDLYEGYVGYAYCVFSELTVAPIPPHVVLVTVNNPDGVEVRASFENTPVEDVVFTDGVAYVAGAQHINVDAADGFKIESFQVNGRKFDAAVEEDEGYSYCVDITEEINTIAINVVQEGVVDMSMNLSVNGLDRFTSLYIMGKKGENSILAEKETLGNGINLVEFKEADLPLQVYGTWEDGMGYYMELSINGEVVKPKVEDSTSAQYVKLNVPNNANVLISMKSEKQIVSLRVNDQNGVRVFAENEEDGKNPVVFENDRAEVAGAQIITIYNADPYLITSVKVNGEEIEATEVGHSYIVEVTEETKTIAIEVEEQEVVEMSMNVTVYGLENFENLAILDKNGGTDDAFALASKDNFEEGVAAPVYFTNMSLPLQILGEWAEGTDYEMVVTLDGEVVAPTVVNSTSAQFIDLEVNDEANLTIALNLVKHTYITVNQAAGVSVIADVVNGEDYEHVNVEFVDGKADVINAEFIRVYNVKPYGIHSVSVRPDENGEDPFVEVTELGRSYLVSVTEDNLTVTIDVEEMQVVERTLNVTVYGLENFESLAILDNDGETGKAMVMESQLVEGEAVAVHYDNIDLPLQVVGSWEEGTGYEMEVILNGTLLAPVVSEAAFAQYVDIEPLEGAQMIISLKAPKQPIAITVNEAEGVEVVADILINDEYDYVTVEFEEGKAEVEDAEIVKIYNVDPYLIASVKVNGEAIEATEEGRSYFIEVTEEVETIDIIVEKQPVVEMSMNVTVYGLENFESLAIMDKDGENGKAIVMESQLEEGVATTVFFENYDLPLQIFGSWADETGYEMVVALDGEILAPVQAESTFALYYGVEVKDGANMTIALRVPQPAVAITVNEAAGVQVIADVVIGEDYTTEDVEFVDGKAEVANAETIRIYNVDPYRIVTVEVNGEAIEATEEGRSYFIEITEEVKDINITVEEQEVVEMTMMVYVPDLDKFEEFVIMDKDGENGKAIAFKEQLSAEELNNVVFTNLDLPLQVWGTWEDGANYVMEVTVDGEVVAPVQHGPTSALFMGVEIGDDQFLTVSLKAQQQAVAITVNEAAGVSVIADVVIDEEYDTLYVEFEDGKAEVANAETIRIYNVDPYRIVSVEVNGEAIEATEEGRSYFIEVTEEVKDINITVEEQEVVEMTMMVYVPDLDKFEEFVIMDKDGEMGKALAFKEQLSAEELNNVVFTNLDLPLQVYGTWEDGKDYVMEVTVDGEDVAPTQHGPTSALFMGVEIGDDQFLTVTLTAPKQGVAITVNEAAGVQVYAENDEDGKYLVDFENGAADVLDAQFITIYNVDPYAIASVKVNGEEIEATEAGRSYFIEVTEETKTIAIEVEEQEVVEMTMTLTVNGLDNFENFVILDKDGENGKAIVMESQIQNGVATEVHFTNLDLPLQIFGLWEEGKASEMVATLDGVELVPVIAENTMALFMDVEPANGSNLVIDLKAAEHVVALTVNNAEGVQVIADVEDEIVFVEFEEGDALVAGAQYIRIYNLDPYRIVSVEVNGEEIEATEEGRSYFIEVTDDVMSIGITVEEQEVEEIVVMVYVEGLDRFEDLVIMDKDGEMGKALAFKDQLSEYELTNLYLTNLDLPLQVWGTWEDGKDYHMVVTVDGEAIEPVQHGPTSALFMDIYVENDQFLTIQLRDATTAINKVDAEAINGKWYNLQGMEVNKANLMPGNVYINSGKKYLVK